MSRDDGSISSADARPSARRLPRFLPAAWPLSAQIILALALALLPLGALAVLAAIGNYNDLRASQADLARSRIESLRRTAAANLDQEFGVLQALLLQQETTPRERNRCDRQFTRIAQIDPLVESIIRIDANGRLLCASSGAALPPPVVLTSAAGVQSGPTRFLRALLLDDSSVDRDLVLGVRNLSVGDDGDSILARVPRARATLLVDPELRRADEHVRLLRFGEPVAVWNGKTGSNPLSEISLAALDQPVEQITARDGSRWLVGSADFTLPGLRLVLARPAAEVSITQALNIALPMMMWLVAVAIGWAGINWLVARPLASMRRSVDRYAAGDSSVRLGGGHFVSQEIEQFGVAFDRMADQIDTHEDELRGALATQKRLTREVHHRVKNNLQIVSSLLSLQSRDAASPEVAYAYATIQKRVNALALVHRWLFDDEAMRGVDLRSLAQDLCAGLEQSVAQSEGANIGITPDVERVYVGQDTAVPLAFLITELVTAAARHADNAPMALRITARAGSDDRATLGIEAPSFRGPDIFAPGSNDPAARIVQGMTRQMRTKLVHDAARGRYSIEFPIAVKG